MHCPLESHWRRRSWRSAELNVDNERRESIVMDVIWYCIDESMYMYSSSIVFRRRLLSGFPFGTGQANNMLGRPFFGFHLDAFPPTDGLYFLPRISTPNEPCAHSNIGQPGVLRRP